VLSFKKDTDDVVHFAWFSKDDDVWCVIGGLGNERGHDAASLHAKKERVNA
jgi:hypothetical protein